MTNDASDDEAARRDESRGERLPDLRAENAGRTTSEANADDPSRGATGSAPAGEPSTEPERRREADLLGE